MNNGIGGGFPPFPRGELFNTGNGFFAVILRFCDTHRHRIVAYITGI